jgi:electron transfer flavoprotein beta subunit
MRIVVCMKQVPRDNTVGITAQQTIDASGIEQIPNLFDEYALEAALQMSDDSGADVSVVSMGSDDVVDQLRRAMAMGATDALRIAADENVDTFAAVTMMAQALREQGLPDVVLCGRNSTDDDTGGFAPMLARVFGWPQVTYVSKVTEVGESHVVVVRQLEDEVETIKVALPAVLSVSKGEQEPRYPSLIRVRKFAKADVPSVTVAATATATSVLTRVPPPARKSGEIIAGADTAAKVATLVDRLIADQAL